MLILRFDITNPYAKCDRHCTYYHCCHACLTTFCKELLHRISRKSYKQISRWE